MGQRTTLCWSMALLSGCAAVERPAPPMRTALAPPTVLSPAKIEGVRFTFSEAIQRMTVCYKEALRIDVTLTGTITLQVRAAVDRAIIDVEPAREVEGFGPTFHACVARSLRGLRLELHQPREFKMTVILMPGREDMRP